MWLTGNPPSIMPARREFGLVCRTVPHPTACQEARDRRPLHTDSGFPRVNLSYEAVEAIVSLDAPGGWGRIYAGGSTLFHRAPATLDRNGVQWGAELRGPAFTAARLRLMPVLGADFKAFEELHWIINANVVGGFEWSRPGSDRRIRLLLNYYHGFIPYGQFFAQKVETVGLGLSLSF